MNRLKSNLFIECSYDYSQAINTTYQVNIEDSEGLNTDLKLNSF